MPGVAFRSIRDVVHHSRGLDRSTKRQLESFNNAYALHRHIPERDLRGLPERVADALPTLMFLASLEHSVSTRPRCGTSESCAGASRIPRRRLSHRWGPSGTVKEARGLTI